MIIIYNEKLKIEILLETNDWIQFAPKHYEEVPHVIIELREYNYGRHALNCKDCKQFVDSFGTDSLDWVIAYNGDVFRLDLTNFNKGSYPMNEYKITHLSEYNSGTRLLLRISDIPLEKSKIKSLLHEAEKIENYEMACKLRDLLDP